MPPRSTGGRLILAGRHLLAAAWSIGSIAGPMLAVLSPLRKSVRRGTRCATPIAEVIEVLALLPFRCLQSKAECLPGSICDRVEVIAGQPIALAKE